MRKTEYSEISVKDEKLFLDGVELKNVKKYKLVNSTERPAELTIKMDVRIGQVVSGSGK